jgi:hypothetical protein
VSSRIYYPSIEDFYAVRGGERSGESDFGVMWTEDRKRFPVFRVSVVHDTGDVYAINMSVGEVELLGTLEHTKLCANLANLAHDAELCAYAHAERALNEWADTIHREGSLEWVRERLGAVPA